MQIGQREDVAVVGAGTVCIGSNDVEDIGGLALTGLEGTADVDVAGDRGCTDAGGEERETVLIVVDCWDDKVGAFGLLAVGKGEGLEGRPEMIGGGRSRPSVAFLESCLAKSEACHHSRNLRAKIEVGRRILRLDRSRGYTTVVKVRGLKMLDACPGRAPGREGISGGWAASAMAR
jgi:hypothetical protein